jgi:tetratricopeptide (TPR) repeat protein
MSALFHNHPVPRILRVVLKGVLLLALATAAILGQSAPGPSVDDATLRLLSIAESQHEIIQLLIQKGDFKRAMQEFRVIMDLRLPLRFEEALMKETVIVARKLYDRGQKEMAYQVLEIGFRQLQVTENKARVLNVKAGMLKNDGRLEEAIETYRAEVELRESGLGR